MANDISVGNLIIGIKTRLDEFKKGMQEAGSDTEKFSGKLDESKGHAVAYGVAFTAVATAVAVAVGKMVMSAADMGDKFYTMSLRTGESAKTLSALAYAGDQAGVSIGSIENAMKRAQRNMADAAQGTGEATKAFKELNIQVTNADGSLISGYELMLRFTEATAGMTDSSKKAALAMEIFGRSGTDLLPLFAEGADGIRKLRDEAEELGIVISDEDAKAADDFKDSLNALKMSVKGISIEIGQMLIPALTSVSEGLLKIVKHTKDMGKDSVDAIKEFGNEAETSAKKFSYLLGYVNDFFDKWARYNRLPPGLSGLLAAPFGRMMGRAKGDWEGSYGVVPREPATAGEGEGSGLEYGSTFKDAEFKQLVERELRWEKEAKDKARAEELQAEKEFQEKLEYENELYFGQKLVIGTQYADEEFRLLQAREKKWDDQRNAEIEREQMAAAERAERIRDEFIYQLEGISYWFNKDILSGGWYNAFDNLVNSADDAGREVAARLMVEAEMNLAESVYNKVLDFFGGETARKAVDLFVDNFGKIKDKIWDAIKWALDWDNIEGMFSQFLSFFSYVGSKIQSAVQWAVSKPAVGKAVETFASTFEKVSEAVKSGIHTALTVVDTIKNVKNWIDEFKNVKDTLISALKWALSDDGLMSAVKSFGKLFENIASSFGANLSSMLAMAAGFVAGLALGGGGGSTGGTWNPGENQSEIRNDFFDLIDSYAKNKGLTPSVTQVDQILAELMKDYSGASAGSRNVNSIFAMNRQYIDEMLRKTGKAVPGSLLSDEDLISLYPGLMPEESRALYGGSFHTGGIIPGVRGQERLARVLAGEEVLTKSDPRHRENRGDSGTVININVSGNTVMNDRDADKLADVIVDAITRKARFQQRYSIA